jgi:CheY-like chemotaxis protein
MRILVAEDDAISRTLLERTLQRAGYAVISVENGAQAIAELVKQDVPRLALLDWIMPEWMEWKCAAKFAPAKSRLTRT